MMGKIKIHFGKPKTVSKPLRKRGKREKGRRKHKEKKEPFHAE
jgi:hypothetical protein